MPQIIATTVLLNRPRTSAGSYDPDEDLKLVFYPLLLVLCTLILFVCFFVAQEYFTVTKRTVQQAKVVSAEVIGKSKSAIRFIVQIQGMDKTIVSHDSVSRKNCAVVKLNEYKPIYVEYVNPPKWSPVSNYTRTSGMITFCE